MEPQPSNFLLLLGMNCWEWFDREEQSWNVNDKKKYVAS
jgi:hypothetical protein